MTESKTTKAVGSLISALQERAKELRCLYRIEELLSESETPLEEIFMGIMEAIPPAWQYPEQCQVKIDHESETYQLADYVETPWEHCALIKVQDATVGRICLGYKEEMPPADSGPFLDEEIRLIDTIADRLGHFILHQRLKLMFEDMRVARQNGKQGKPSEWRVALDLLRKTDEDLLIRISRKMINYLGWRGIGEAKSLLQRFGQERESADLLGQVNQPEKKAPLENPLSLSDETFRVAAVHLSDAEILTRIHKWILEDRSSILVDVLVNGYAPLDDVSDAVRRYQHLMPEGMKLPKPTMNGLRVALVRRFFSDQLEFINVAKKHVEIEDFFDLLERIIFSSGSHGKLGGKSAGIFVASAMLRKKSSEIDLLENVKTPKTWYVASDGILAFLRYNNLGEVYEQKYKEIDEVRREYPHIVQVFKNSTFPPELVKGLSVALDDFREVPLVVRSSSLLEDRLGTAFAGKYKSLFLANQGDKSKRLEALMDAIAEVYASTFSPDPIEYRCERGLLDFHEEMGIMIQEVVGKRVGKYFMPCFAGVAFSRNEFRWSSRIKREDGLLRIVPGLGTRAVDRLSDDYPILVAPGRPKLRVNVTIDETVRYSPKKIDVINLEKSCFETKEIDELISECDQDYPSISKVISIYRDGLLRPPLGLLTDLSQEDVVVTFDGLISKTSFVDRMAAILRALEHGFGTPVDIEFASDGEDLYLLQCRPQASSSDDAAAEIPKNVPAESVLFSANRFVSNGWVPDITHIVYVDPQRYDTLSEFSELVAVGQAIGKLNRILPKRQFILMGPGRWGSRGDIKLGVRVTYSDINNSAMLIEVARKKGKYVPEVSFGTHFFQDLVEASIRYLPLYPDEQGVKFNEEFLLSSPNILPKILPEYGSLSETIRVIDIPKTTDGRILRVLMNAAQDEALGLITESSSVVEFVREDAEVAAGRPGEDYWSWRLRMAKRIAAQIAPERFGVKAFYIFGSTKNGTAGPASDIDLLIHFQGTDEQKKELEVWLEGWSECLAELNYLKTGYKTDGLLDVHLLTDTDIEARSSFAMKIGAVTDAARELPMKAGQRSSLSAEAGFSGEKRTRASSGPS